MFKPLFRGVFDFFIPLICFCAALQAGQSSPNFLIILTDDQRPDTVSAYAPNGVNQTPHIDRLAREGILFQRAYVTSPICAVSRASILTGQQPRNHQVHYFETAPSDEKFDQTFPVQLKDKSGYHIGQIGKYGIGVSAVQRKNYDYFVADSGQGKAFKMVDGRKVHDAEWVTIMSERFFAEMPDDRPFCLQLNYKEPHPSSVPAPEDNNVLDTVTLERHLLDSPEENAKLPEHIKETLGSIDYATRMRTDAGFQDFAKNYFEKVLSVDRSVGAVMADLERIGRLKNTIVIFLSDHGTALGKRQLGGKWTPYEENLRIPYIVYDGRAPRKMGQESDALVLSIDLAATVLDLAGLSAPDDYDGLSIAPLLQDPSLVLRTGFPFEYSCSPAGVPSYLARYEGYMGQDFKYVRWEQRSAVPVKPTHAELFFNLKEDPFEQQNLAQDGDYQEHLQEYRRHLERWTEAHPNTYRYNTYHGRAQALSPEIDWKLFEEKRPREFKRIKEVINELGVSFDDATFDWETRKQVSKKARYWY